MAKGAAYETSYCRRGLFGGRAYTSKEARYGAFRGCCPVHGGFKTQRMLRSRDFTGGRLFDNRQNHYIHLTDLGRDVAEKFTNAIVFLLINLYPLELIHKLQKLMLVVWNMQSVMKVFKN